MCKAHRRRTEKQLHLGMELAQKQSQSSGCEWEGEATVSQ